MTKRDLEKYQKHKQLIAAYMAELASDMTTADTVTGSMSAHPYVERVMTIRGRDVNRDQWLRMRIRALTRQCMQAARFVDEVEDEHMRALLYWHYLEGQSWPMVRKTLRVRDVTANCLRMRVDAFFRKSS